MFDYTHFECNCIRLAVDAYLSVMVSRDKCTRFHHLIKLPRAVVVLRFGERLMRVVVNSIPRIFIHKFSRSFFVTNSAIYLTLFVDVKTIPESATSCVHSPIAVLLLRGEEFPDVAKCIGLHS